MISLQNTEIKCLKKEGKLILVIGSHLMSLTNQLLQKYHFLNKLLLNNRTYSLLVEH